MMTTPKMLFNMVYVPGTTRTWYLVVVERMCTPMGFENGVRMF